MVRDNVPSKWNRAISTLSLIPKLEDFISSKEQDLPHMLTNRIYEPENMMVMAEVSALPSLVYKDVMLSCHCSSKEQRNSIEKGTSV